MAISLVPLILLSWVRDLKYLAPFSTLATVLTLTSFGIILYYVFRDVPSISDRVAIGDITKYPLFIGTALFSLEAIGVVSYRYLIYGHIDADEPLKRFVSKLGGIR